MVKDENEILPPIVSTNITFETNLFIKFALLMCANGGIGPLVFVLQWETMPPEQFVCLRVPGLTNTTMAAQVGYILVTKTRCGNRASWKHLFSTIVLPHIKSHQEALGRTQSNLNLDGEAIILSAIMEADPSEPAPSGSNDAMIPVEPILPQRTVIDEANAQNLAMDKLGAGRTIREQAADGCKGGFRGTKSYMRKIVREEINYENLSLHARILKAFDEIVRSPGCEDANLPMADKEKYADGLCMIVYAMKNSDALHPDVLANAFVLCGQHAKRVGEMDYEPPEFVVPGFLDPSVDIGKLLTNNMCDNTEEEMQQMIESFPAECALIRQHGTLTRAQMDELKIPRLDDDEPARDGLALWRQGATMLNSEHTLARLAVFRAERRELTEEEKEAKAKEDAEVKRLADAQKLVSKATEGTARKRQKAEAAEAEKVRFASLSAEEQKAEKEAKKEAAAAKKRANAEAKQKELDDANAIIANANPDQLAGAAERRAGRGGGRHGGGGRGGGGGRARGGGRGRGRGRG